MHDFIASGGIYTPSDANWLYVMITLVGILLLGLVTTWFLSKKTITIAMIVIVCIATSLMVLVHIAFKVQDYEGIFKVDNIHYNLGANHNIPSKITIENKNHIKSTFEYKGQEDIRKNDTVKIVLTSQPKQHPTINKNLNHYKIKSIKKVK